MSLILSAKLLMNKPVGRLLRILTDIIFVAEVIHGQIRCRLSENFTLFQPMSWGSGSDSEELRRATLAHVCRASDQDEIIGEAFDTTLSRDRHAQIGEEIRVDGCI